MPWQRKNRQTRSTVVTPDGTSWAPGAAAVVTLAWAFLAIGPTAALSEEAATPKAKESATPAATKKAESQKPATRVRWTTSRVVGSPEPPYPYVFRRAFPGLKFDKPVYMIPEPGTDRIFILQYPNGLVFAIRDDPKTTESKRDPQVPRWEGGILRMPFDHLSSQLLEEPAGFHFRQRTAREGVNGQRRRRVRIWRFHVAATPPYAIVRESGEKIIEWPSAGHDGGDMGFGPRRRPLHYRRRWHDRIRSGHYGQDITDLKASILRIDVDHPAPGKPYSIPKDNPFLHIPNAQYGDLGFWRAEPVENELRPGDRQSVAWRRRTGPLGDDLSRAQDGDLRVERDGGLASLLSRRKIGPAPISPPIVEHHHSEARSITGGYVYHGKRLPELANHYLYCCYQTGTVFSLRKRKSPSITACWQIRLTTAPRGDAITQTSCI